ncbi:MAG: sugar transferase [Treponema sp.]|jgi:lipopolysaccharide/colanic/teichoic acid biosynthesis glycosyltransferase|nr:sugar transferase [Treponema sp.]
MNFRDARVIRIMDIVLALALLPFVLLVFMLLSLPQLCVFGKILYVSPRLGRKGRTFTYVKLQSMYDREDPPVLPVSPVSPGGGASRVQGGGRAYLERERIPPWGRFLRRTHLDELPEIFFILVGTESFVGPRPLLAEHAALVDSPERRMLKPGWTGFSQVFLKRRKILPSRIQRRLDIRLGRELRPALYLRLLCATIAVPSRRSVLKPGPTVRAYRASLVSPGSPEKTSHEID